MNVYIDQGSLIIIPIVAVIYMGILYLFVVSTFFLASFVDPGIYPRGVFIGQQVCGLGCGIRLD